ncbi:MAG TPA: ATP-binding protein [Lacipirellulaceae bacterium]
MSDKASSPKKPANLLAHAIELVMNEGHMTKFQGNSLIASMLSQHFRPLPVSELTITERQFPYRVRADLQRAINRLFNETTRVTHFCGVKKQYDHNGITFSDLIYPSRNDPAVSIPPQFEEVDIGEAEPARCLKNGFWLVEDTDCKFAVFLAPAQQFGRTTGVEFHVAAPRNDGGQKWTQQFFKHLEESVLRSEFYRGKILSLEVGEMYSGMSAGVRVHKLRTVERDQVILPGKTLELLDRNIIQFAQQRKRLAEFRMSTKKGLLFYGPPGTGKTHTIHYLAGAMRGHTTLLITAEQVGLLAEYMTLARLLQPSIVVIEDADLIARERSTIGSTCEEILLNKLLNEMDGLRPETDVFFILTTNRPQALEAALASRPGRIDQAIEFPLPDAEGRQKLVNLYSGGLNVTGHVVEATINRTEGVSASFIKELMRRAAQFHLEKDDGNEISIEDINRALEELLFANGSLNHALLGVQSPKT